MNKAEFTCLIQAAGLQLVLAMEYEIRFIVSYRAEKQYGTRFQQDALIFGRDEFFDMSAEQAIKHISDCKGRLVKVARTQQGRLPDKAARKPVQKKPEPTPVLSTIGYPAH